METPAAEKERQENAKVGDSVCPRCKSTQIGWHPIELVVGLGTLDTHCKDCSASWTAIYHYTGFMGLCDENGDDMEKHPLALY